MLIKDLKVFNSVKCGPKELMFLKSSDGYKIELLDNGPLIEITDKDNNTVLTSLYNSPWFTRLGEDEPKASKSNITRIKQKKTKSPKVVK